MEAAKCRVCPRDIDVASYSVTIMDKRVHQCPGLNEADIEYLHKVEEGLAITADVSRADALLCTLLDDNQALVARHVIPHSTPSLYRAPATGRILHPEEQPLIFRALRSGNSGSGQREVLSSGAPIIQDVFPIQTEDKRIIGAVAFEINMVAHERHRRRNRAFRQAVRWLQGMCLRGELADTAMLGRFGQYDGVYLVDRDRDIVYMSGSAANLFRSIGILSAIRTQHIDTLEPLDAEVVERAFHSHKPDKVRRESGDGRIWVRKVIPLKPPPATWLNWQNYLPWHSGDQHDEDNSVEAVLVLIRNATEAVQKQRELNVKSAIIKEVHHRVKNNLQTIAAMLRIQARRCETNEARQALMDSVNRVLSMAVIHEFLSQDEHRPINIRDVCQRVATQVVQVGTGPDQVIDVRVEGPSIRLPAGQATPTAMVVNELVLNALEHGVSQQKEGRITIKLTDLGDSVRIVVEDDGMGVPPDFDPEQSDSLGLQIVHTLVTDDLKGNLEISAAHPEVSETEEDRNEAAGHAARGTRATVTIPKRVLR